MTTYIHHQSVTTMALLESFLESVVDFCRGSFVSASASAAADVATDRNSATAPYPLALKGIP